MRKTGVFSFFFLLSLTLGAAPGQTTIDTALNKITGVHNLATSMAKLKVLHDWPDRKFVVVHFGDSHIQGDNFTGAIRNNLQSVFGNGGEGVLFPYSLCKSFGPKTLTSTSTGTWTWATVLKNPTEIEIGVTGYTLISTDSNATLTFSYAPESGATNICDVRLWYGGWNSMVLLNHVSAGLSIEYDETVHRNGMNCAIIHGYKPGQNISFRFKKSTNKAGFHFLFHGISFGGDSGLVYNRCGVVGATFLQLAAQQDFTLEHLRYLKPDLILFSYGSNESYNTGLDMKVYAGTVSSFIDELQDAFPETDIVITSPPDTRAGNRFPVNTQPITDSLRVICERQNCAFWDLHGIMGGDKSIYFWLNNSLARKDKLHFTKAGYELQGNLFSEALLNVYTETYTLDDIPNLKTISEKIVTQLSTLKESGTSPAPAASGNNQEHIVKKGETLSIIARNNKVTVDQLCEWNNIRKTDVLRIGQKIVIRK